MFSTILASASWRTQTNPSSDGDDDDNGDDGGGSHDGSEDNDDNYQHLKWAILKISGPVPNNLPKLFHVLLPITSKT